MYYAMVEEKLMLQMAPNDQIQLLFSQSIFAMVEEKFEF